MKMNSINHDKRILLDLNEVSVLLTILPFENLRLINVLTLIHLHYKFTLKKTNNNNLIKLSQSKNIDIQQTQCKEETYKYKRRKKV